MQWFEDDTFSTETTHTQSLFPWISGWHEMADGWSVGRNISSFYPQTKPSQNIHQMQQGKSKRKYFFHKRLSFFINFPSYFLDTYHVQSFSFLQATMTQSARKIDWFRGIGNENRLFSCKIKSLIWAFGRSHSSSSLPPSLSFYFGN